MVQDHATATRPMPFRQASSVIVQIRIGSILRYATFQAVESLTIISNSAISLPAIDIVETITQMTDWNLSIRKPPTNMAIAGYLPPALEEFCNRHESRLTFLSLQTRIQLPKIGTLGLTYGSMGLLEVGSMVKLQALMLFGSSDPTESHQVQLNDNADQNYSGVAE
jgi:hypothetical protein